MARTTKKVAPMAIAFFGGITFKDVFLGFHENKSDMLELINGTKSFFEITPATQIFCLTIFILIVTIIVFALGYLLYNKWHCANEYEVEEVT
jgi:hypothetical protein